MEKTVSVVDDSLRTKSPIASAIFMGLGQILYLRQYVRGAILIAAEIIMLCCIIFGTKSISYEELDSGIIRPEAYISALQELSGLDENENFDIASQELIDLREASLEELADSYGVSVKKLMSLAKEDDEFNEYADNIALIDEEFHSEAQALIEEYYPETGAAFGYSEEDYYDVAVNVLYELDPAYVEKLDAKMEKSYASLYKKYKVADQGELDDYLYELEDDAQIEKIELEIEKIENRYTTDAVKYLAKNYPAVIDCHYDGCSVCKAAHRSGNNTTKHFAWFRGPVVNALIGLVTLGDAAPDSVPVKFRDHSIFMMIEGLIMVIFVGLFIFVYIWNIFDARKSAEVVLRNGCFAERDKANSRFWDRSFPFFALVLPVLMICFFTIVPLLFSALVAFTNYSQPHHVPPANTVDWVGMENFRTMFMSSGSNSWTGAFGRIIIWTVIWAFAATITCFVTGMIMAVILVDKRIKIAPIFRTIYIIPYAIPGMLSLFVWANLLNGTFGPINRTLMELGLISSPIPFLSDPTMAKVTLIVVNIWLGFPYSMILVTSNMTAIPGQLYEAATIDGANKYQQFAKITVPLVLYQTMPLLIMQFAGNINNFGAVFFLTGGNPAVADTSISMAGATDLLITWVYKLTFNPPQQYNMASVIAILIFIVLVPFALFNFTRTKSFREGEV